MSVKNFIKSMLMLSLLTISSVSFAQQNMQTPVQRTPEERAQRQTQWMQQNLKLTDDQYKKVYDIVLKSAKQVDAARNAGGDMRPQMKSINESRDAAMKGVLTGDQYQQYEQHKEQMQQQRRNMPQGGGNMQQGGGGN